MDSKAKVLSTKLQFLMFMVIGLVFFALYQPMMDSFFEFFFITVFKARDAPDAYQGTMIVLCILYNTVVLPCLYLLGKYVCFDNPRLRTPPLEPQTKGMKIMRCLIFAFCATAFFAGMWQQLLVDVMSSPADYPATFFEWLFQFLNLSALFLGMKFGVFPEKKEKPVPFGTSCQGLFVIFFEFISFSNNLVTLSLMLSLHVWLKETPTW